MKLWGKWAAYLGCVLLSPCALADLDAVPLAYEARDLEEQQLVLQAQQQQQVQDILASSGMVGLSSQVRHIAQQVFNELDAPIGQQYDVIDRLARWSPQAIEQRLGALLLATDETQRQHIQQLLNHEKLLAARNKELQAISHQGDEAYQEYMQRLRSQPPVVERAQWVRDIDQAMQFSALLVAARADVYKQVQAVVRGFQPPENWQRKVEQDVSEFLLFVYRSTPNDELRTLVQLYRDPILQQWLVAVRNSLQADV